LAMMSWTTWLWFLSALGAGSGSAWRSFCRQTCGRFHRTKKPEHRAAGAQADSRCGEHRKSWTTKRAYGFLTLPAVPAQGAWRIIVDDRLGVALVLSAVVAARKLAAAGGRATLRVARDGASDRGGTDRRPSFPSWAAPVTVLALLPGCRTPAKRHLIGSYGTGPDLAPFRSHTPGVSIFSTHDLGRRDRRRSCSEWVMRWDTRSNDGDGPYGSRVVARSRVALWAPRLSPETRSPQRTALATRLLASLS